MKRTAWVAGLLVVGAAGPARAQHFGLERVGGSDSVLVGEVVTLRARVHIGPQQNLASPVPSVVGELPEGVRLLGADTLRQDGARTVLAGDVRVAFYRPGRHQVPPLRLILKAIASDRGQALEPDPLYVEVGNVLPPGNPTLRDIRDSLPRAPVSPFVWVAAAVAAGCILAGVRAWRRRRGGGLDPVATAASSVVASTPLSRAQAALDQLAAGPWAGADPYYEQATMVLRQYLLEVAPGTSPSHTSRELLATLAHRSANGAWGGMQRVLTDADVVKFAGQRPSASDALAWTDNVRGVLATWDAILSALPAHPPARPPAQS